MRHAYRALLLLGARGGDIELPITRLPEGVVRSSLKTGKLDDQGAVTEDISNLRPEDFERLRRGIIQALAR